MQRTENCRFGNLHFRKKNIPNGALEVGTIQSQIFLNDQPNKLIRSCKMMEGPPVTPKKMGVTRGQLNHCFEVNWKRWKNS
jgi:hypothetical protein